MPVNMTASNSKVNFLIIVLVWVNYKIGLKRENTINKIYWGVGFQQIIHGADLII